MKLIGLMPARNEDWVLKTSIEVALRWCDGLIVLDHASTDGTSKIIEEFYARYPFQSPERRLWSIRIADDSWDEMDHRQRMLEAARRAEATHIALIDADEIVTGDLLTRVRMWIENLEYGQLLTLPLYNLRGSLDHYHETGIWGNRRVSVAFKDSRDLSWKGNQFHHREPFFADEAKSWIGVQPVGQGQGGILHLWGADLRRLQSKHALYKMTERLRYPDKSLDEIEEMYNLWRGPRPIDPIWRIAQVPEEWWAAYRDLKSGIQMSETPWQEAECRRLYEKHGSLTFQGLDLFGCAQPPRVETGPIFSLCHSTARPEGWQEAARSWLQKCDHPEKVEYILSVDEGTDVDPLMNDLTFPNSKIVINTKRRCSVDGWNRAAQASTGRFLINLADDLAPCEHWDTELLRAIPNLNQDCVLEVDTGSGTPAGLMPFCFLTRRYLEKLTDRYGYEGGFFYPGYRGMYCDTEFTDLAKRDGVVIGARHLLFEHRHPFFGKGEMDAIYHRQNSPDEYANGKAIYDERMRSLGLTGIANEVKKFIIAVCLPGEQFRYDWVSRWTEIFAHLNQNWIVLPLFGYCSNVYVNRLTMAAGIENYHIQPHLILWIDDDNIPTVEQINLLISDLNDHPEADAVAGWCWINRGTPGLSRWGLSCGYWQDGTPVEFGHEDLMSGIDELKEVGWTGFPLILMRRELLNKAGGSKAFLPVLLEKHPLGFTGEDTGFSLNAKNAGARIFVDRRVRVPHLKMRDDVPSESVELTAKT